MYDHIVATIRRTTLWDKAQTARAMYGLTRAFASDLGAMAKMPLQGFFDMVRKIPYVRDVKGREVVARPLLILKEFPAIDCKKKAILIASYLQMNAIPWRFVASSVRKDKRVHHVFTQALIDGEWKNVDPTYSHFKLFEPKRNLTKLEMLQP